MAEIQADDMKSNTFQYSMVGRWIDGTIVPPSDGPMFILIDWEYFSESVSQ